MAKRQTRGSSKGERTAAVKPSAIQAKAPARNGDAAHRGGASDKTAATPALDGGPAQPARTPIKFYIGTSKYIRVWVDRGSDDKPILRPFDPPFEGAFGYVLTVFKDANVGGGSAARPTICGALKIPRLQADSRRENELICSVVAAEVSQMTRFDGADFKSSGILVPDEQDILRWPIANCEAYDKRLNDHYVVVKYDKTRGVVFGYASAKGILHGLGNEEINPGGGEQPQASLADDAVWARAIECAQMSGSSPARGFVLHSVVLVSTFEANSSIGGEQSVSSGPEAEKEGSREFERVSAMSQPVHSVDQGSWYLGLPSVLYPWAGLSLEQYLSYGVEVNSGIKVSDGVQIASALVGGMCKVFGAEGLHGDLRPANILRLGTGTPGDLFKGGPILPGGHLWRIADFAFVPPETYSAPAGGTQIGPVLPGERVSPFYAPERMSVREYENADAVRFFGGSGKSAESIVAVVGWYHEVGEISRVPERVEDGTRTRIDRMIPGDRIRLRENVFEVVEHYSGRVGSAVVDVVVCMPRVWEVFHERVLILRSNDAIGEFPFTLRLPRVVAIQKWSAATDCYSLGACLLYIFFSIGYSQHGSERRRQSARDDEFRDMVDAFTSQPVSSYLWGHVASEANALLDALGIAVAAGAAKHPNIALCILGRSGLVGTKTERETVFAMYLGSDDRSPIRPKKAPSAGKPNLNNVAESEESRTLLERSIATTLLLTSAVPHLDTVFRAFNNVATFMLFVHYCMRLMYRRSALPPPSEAKVEQAATGAKSVRSKKLEKKVGGSGHESPVVHFGQHPRHPFCRSREDLPSADLAVEMRDEFFSKPGSLGNLDGVQYLLMDFNLVGRTEYNLVRPFEPVTVHSLRVDKDRLSQELDQVRSSLRQEKRERQQDALRRQEDIEKQIRDLSGNIEQLKTGIATRQSEIERLKVVERGLLDKGQADQRLIENQRREIGNLEKRIDQASKEIERLDAIRQEVVRVLDRPRGFFGGPTAGKIIEDIGGIVRLKLPE